MTNLEHLAKLIRLFILQSTTAAGSGHPSSSLSAVELMTVLFFGGFFKFDPSRPEYHNNDRLIFSKGHASPLLYAIWAAAGTIEYEELLTLRKFTSRLEGHPTSLFPYTECATGSLGQGLSVGVGMALNAQHLDHLPYRTWVLLGDSEMAEGSVWEALEIASHYKLGSLVGIMDVNRLGQRGKTMLEHDLETYANRVASFGWKTIIIDGHNLDEVTRAYETACSSRDNQPIMIIAKTLKGKGISFIEDKDGWHGKALKQEECARAIQELGKVDVSLRGTITRPEEVELDIRHQASGQEKPDEPSYDPTKLVSTRRAYGNALVRLANAYPSLIALDAEVSNSTYAEFFKELHPERFFEMYIAEQNMAGAALGLARRGNIPFISTFSAFFARAFDQIRMNNYSGGNVKYVGSHAGVSIGEDGASQMGLEDIALFRTLLDSVVLYPSDAVSTERLVERAADHNGPVYIRTTRKDTPLLYGVNERFPIGGCKVIRESASDAATIVAAGITLHEALEAHATLAGEGINIRVIDVYSIKPLDTETLKKCAKETRAIITVEDHYAQGGIGEAVASALADTGTRVHMLAVKKLPRSGTPEELLDYEDISARSIVEKVKNLLS